MALFLGAADFAIKGSRKAAERIPKGTPVDPPQTQTDENSDKGSCLEGGNCDDNKDGNSDPKLSGEEGIDKAIEPKQLHEKPDYSSIEDPVNAGEGKDFTPRQKKEALEINKKFNNGEVKSDISGEKLVRPQKSQKTITPNESEWQFDHIKPKSNGGTNKSSNLQIISRKENRIKWDK